MPKTQNASVNFVTIENRRLHSKWGIAARLWAYHEQTFRNRMREGLPTILILCEGLSALSHAAFLESPSR